MIPIHKSSPFSSLERFRSVFTALVTPFLNNRIDFASFQRLIEFQLQSGIQGFVISGTTGESPNLSRSEKKSLFEFARKLCPKGFPLVVGTGTNSTQHTIEESREAESWGVDAVLVVVPYYNKPPQRGLYEHFSQVANSIQIPTLLYNVPGRTGISLELETVVKLSRNPKIIGIKEASGNIALAEQLRSSCRKDFLLISGDDGTYDEFMAKGGDGVISVVSHVIPQAIIKKEASIHSELIQLLFSEANPIPVKKALKLMGLIESDELRLPLVTLSDSLTEKLAKQLKSEGLFHA